MQCLAFVAMFASAGAFAANTVTAPIASYNSAAIEAAHGIVTVPFGTTIGNATYVVDSASTLVSGSQFTIGLPAGFLFYSTPGLILSSGSATLTSGGVGANTAVFTIGSAVAGSSTISLTAFSVSGVDQLQVVTPSYSPLPMTFQASQLDAQPLTAGVFASGYILLPDFRLGGGTIDLAAPTLGRAFGNNPASDVPSALIGDLSLDALQEDPFTPSLPLLNPNGSLATLTAGDTATITFVGVNAGPLMGYFNGIASAFAVPAALGAACPASAPAGAVMGTVTTNSLTFSHFPIDAPGTYTIGSAGYYQICIVASGLTVIHDNPDGFDVVMADGPDFTGLTVPNNNGLPITDQFTYVGGTPPVAPTIASSFAAASIALNGSTSLTFTLTNPNASYPLTGVGFTDTLPVGMTIASLIGLGNSCGGTVTAVAGSSNVSLAGAALAAAASCVLSVNVTSAQAGVASDTTGEVTSNEASNGNTATASVTVNQAANAITFAPLPSVVNYGTAPILLVATSSSGLSVAFAATGPARIVGDVLIITGVGSVVVTASQTGNSNYLAATPVSQTLTVISAPVSAPTLSNALLTMLALLLAAFGLEVSRRRRSG